MSLILCHEVRVFPLLAWIKRSSVWIASRQTQGRDAEDRCSKSTLTITLEEEVCPPRSCRGELILLLVSWRSQLGTSSFLYSGKEWEQNRTQLYTLGYKKYRMDFKSISIFLLLVFTVQEALLCSSCDCIAERGRGWQNGTHLFESALFQILDVLIRGQQNNSFFSRSVLSFPVLFFCSTGHRKKIPVPP